MVNVLVSSENDGTLRNNVPDYLIHFTLEWVDDSGTPHTISRDDYFLVDLLGWLRAEHPVIARRFLEEIALRIARVRYNVNDAEML